MKKLLDFPFLSLASAYFTFRLVLAAVFVGHAAMRFFVPHYFESAGRLLEMRGLPFGVAIAWAVTLVELFGGALLVANRYTRAVTLCFFLITAATMVLVQAPHGWWVAEYSDGGMEFSFVVCAMCVFAAAMSREQESLA